MSLENGVLKHLRGRSRYIKQCVYVSHLVMSLFVTPWTVTHQAPLSLGFSRQEYRSGLPFLPPGRSSWSRDQTQGLLHCRQIPYHLSHHITQNNYLCTFKSASQVPASVKIMRMIRSRVTHSDFWNKAKRGPSVIMKKQHHKKQGTLTHVSRTKHIHWLHLGSHPPTLQFVMALEMFHILLMKKLHRAVKNTGRRAHWQQKVRTLNCVSTTPLKWSRLRGHSNAHHWTPYIKMLNQSHNSLMNGGAFPHTYSSELQIDCKTKSN